jgi:two-component system, NtrC family, response regulator AtoC
MTRKVLIVDDDPDMVDAIAEGLEEEGYDTIKWHSADEAFFLLERSDIDCVLTDVRMRGTDGIQLCERIATNRPDLPVIVITGHGSIDSAIAALRAGAYDYITKPFELDQLLVTVRRAIEHRDLQDELKMLKQPLEEPRNFPEIVGNSAPMQRLFDLLERVCDSDTSVLITGESGTGKELVAKTLHRRSRRGSRPFVAINCAAMPENLLESELFGHTKGSFTGAHATKAGLMVEADGGTLFLDEIGDMPPGLQAKLLRALQQKTVRAVGDVKEVPFDARIIAATNSDLEDKVERGDFREDLYFRLNVIEIEIPPLRDRSNDVLTLAQHFMEKFAERSRKPVRAISPEVADKLLSYPWPGNVRELSNCIERAVVLSRGEELGPDSLPENIRAHKRSSIVVNADETADFVPLDDLHRRYIQRVLEAVHGNKSQAAKILGFDRRTLYRRLERYGMA